MFSKTLHIEIILANNVLFVVHFNQKKKKSENQKYLENSFKIFNDKHIKIFLLKKQIQLPKVENECQKIEKC